MTILGPPFTYSSHASSIGIIGCDIDSCESLRSQLNIPKSHVQVNKESNSLSSRLQHLKRVGITLLLVNLLGYDRTIQPPECPLLDPRCIRTFFHRLDRMRILVLTSPHAFADSYLFTWVSEGAIIVITDSESFTQKHSEEAIRTPVSLTARQRQLCNLLSQRKSLREIAAELAISVKTLEVHVSFIKEESFWNLSGDNIRDYTFGTSTAEIPTRSADAALKILELDGESFTMTSAKILDLASSAGKQGIAIRIRTDQKYSAALRLVSLDALEQVADERPGYARSGSGSHGSFIWVRITDLGNELLSLFRTSRLNSVEHNEESSPNRDE